MSEPCFVEIGNKDTMTTVIVNSGERIHRLSWNDKRASQPFRSLLTYLEHITLDI